MPRKVQGIRRLEKMGVRSVGVKKWRSPLLRCPLAPAISTANNLHDFRVWLRPGRRTIMRELVVGIVPVQARDLPAAVLVGVCGAVIVKEREVRVGARVD